MYNEKKDTRRRGIRRRESRPATSVGVVADENQKKMNKKKAKRCHGN